VDLTALNRRMLESLIKAGALDELKGLRSQHFAVIDAAMEGGQRAQRDKLSGQAGLFGMEFGGEQEKHEQPLPTLPDWTDTEKLTWEKEMLGFYITGHPLDRWMDKVRELATHNSESLEGLNKGDAVVLCGIVTGLQRRRNKEGKLWALFQLEDHNGAIECMVFTTQYERLQQELADDKAVMLRGSALPEEGAATRISVQDLVPLEVARVSLPSLISIKIRILQNGTDKARALHELFERKPGDAQVRLRLEKPRDFSVILDVVSRVRPDKEFRAEVERICGPEALEILAS
jgi:DNA polymerase-3 subunit alpha